MNGGDVYLLRGADPVAACFQVEVLDVHCEDLAAPSAANRGNRARPARLARLGRCFALEATGEALVAKGRGDRGLIGRGLKQMIAARTESAGHAADAYMAPG